MRRPCDRCGREYEARSSRSRFCGSTCRARSSDERKVTAIRSAAEPTGAGGACVAAARDALSAVDRLDTPAGAAALVLAEVLDAKASTSLASVAKEFRAAMDAALAGVAPEADRVDELRARREQRFRGA